MIPNERTQLRPQERYFDFNASTPVHPLVAEACLPYLRGAFANPSSAHPEGRAVRASIDAARGSIAASIGAEADEVFFTSGGTEANNWALQGSLALAPRAHFVVGAVEHKSVLSTAEELERRGHPLTILPVDAAGAVRVRDVERALRKDTAFVSVMCANNETGIVQPVREIAALCRERGVRFHTDAVCTIGKLPVDVRDLGCDLLSLASHKLYAPKGCGVLWIRRGVEIAPFVRGCSQQDGRRGGTEDALAIVGFGRACEILARGGFTPARELEALRDALWRGIGERFPRARRNGEGASLPNTLNVCFPGSSASELQAALGALGFSVSAGSAAGGARPSHVLAAMGDAASASSSVRFSLGSGSSAAGVETLLAALERALPVGVESVGVGA